MQKLMKALVALLITVGGGASIVSTSSVAHADTACTTSVLRNYYPDKGHSVCGHNGFHVYNYHRARLHCSTGGSTTLGYGYGPWVLITDVRYTRASVSTGTCPGQWPYVRYVTTQFSG